MMGHQPIYQNKLFITGFNLDKRIRQDHPLRKILEKIDFDFIYDEVKDSYGYNLSLPLITAKLLKILTSAKTS